MKNMYLIKKVLIPVVCLAIVLVLTGCNEDNNPSSDNGKKVYYDFGHNITTSSPTNYKDVIKSSGSNVFAKLDQEQLSVCIYRNETLECFKNNSYDEEEKHLKNVFGANNCSIDNPDGSDLNCKDESISCYLFSSGRAHCYDLVNKYTCNVMSSNEVMCYKY